MGKTPWTDGLPLVDVPQSDTTKPVTFVYPYYCNPQFLRQQLGWWGTYPDHVKTMVRAIIVDDGSPETPASDVLADSDTPFPIRLFRIEQDVRWNWIAARNIGMTHANEGWCLLTDMDHVVTAPTAEACIYGRHDPGLIYGFSRIEQTGEAIGAHPNSWFMTRQMFWHVGGYDEALSGHYGTDGDWRRRCASTAPMAILRERLVRHEYSGDSSTTRYLRKQPEDAAVKRLVSARRPGWRPKTLTFPYHEIDLAHA